MVRGHEDEAHLSRQRRASVVGGVQGEGGRGGNGRSSRETAVDKSRKEMADRVARHQTDQEVEHAYATRPANWCSWFERGLPLASFFLPCA